MSHPDVEGVVVISRNGDRHECYQDPVSYKASPTESTPLGEVQAHQLGSYLRRLYFNPSSSSSIRGISSEIVDLKEVHVRVKVGGEGASVFDSATATLQGLFPPNEKNRITLANDTTVVAPLGGMCRLFYEARDSLPGCEQVINTCQLRLSSRLTTARSSHGLTARYVALVFSMTFANMRPGFPRPRQKGYVLGQVQEG
jgi:hypothetical protein